jgi:hypothetical protein
MWSDKQHCLTVFALLFASLFALVAWFVSRY